MDVTHVHADAISILIGMGILIFDLALLKGIAITMLAKYPDSSTWKALGFIVGLPTA